MPQAKENIDRVIAALSTVGNVTRTRIIKMPQSDTALTAIVEVEVEGVDLAVKFLSSNSSDRVSRQGLEFDSKTIGEVVKGDRWLRLELYGLN